MNQEERNRYYLEVLPKGEKPKWPRPTNELITGSQELNDEFTQNWAYHPDSGRAADDLPPAEVIARENPAPKAAILIDQPLPEVKGDEDEEVLELVLVKDGHAWAHLTSSIKSLGDNVNDLLKIAKGKFDLSVEHFMTTDRVSEAVEKKLDSLEQASEEEEKEPAEDPVEEPELATKSTDSEDQEVAPVAAEAAESVDPAEDLTEEVESLAAPEKSEEAEVEKEVESAEEEGPSNLSDLSDSKPIRHVQTSSPHNLPTSGIYASNAPRSQNSESSSKKWVLIPVLLLLLAFVGLVFFRDQVFSRFASQSVTEPEVTPTPTTMPSPTPTLAPIERGEFKVRVLNGTEEAGKARELGDILRDKGWEIVRVGNNTNQDVSKGYVRMKEGKDDALKTLLSDLGDGYEASSEADIKGTDNTDLEVVIGSGNI